MIREEFHDALVILGLDAPLDHFKTWADRLMAHDAKQRQQIETLELACGAAVQEAQDQREEIERLVARTWNENVQFIQESKENLLQQYVNLTQMYGEQKHRIRELEAEITRLRERIKELADFIADLQEEPT